MMSIMKLDVFLNPVLSSDVYNGGGSFCCLFFVYRGDFLHRHILIKMHLSHRQRQEAVIEPEAFTSRISTATT